MAQMISTAQGTHAAQPGAAAEPHRELDERAHDGRDDDGEEAVADEAQALEEHDGAAQQDDVDGQHHRAQRHLSEHQLGEEKGQRRQK